MGLGYAPLSTQLEPIPMKDFFADQPFWYKPKLIAAATVFFVASVALFTKFLGGGEWLSAATITLAVYTAGNIVENKAILGAK